ncbi:MAG: type III secretion system inner rod subunit SctI [Plesiomonas sp.]
MTTNPVNSTPNMSELLNNHANDNIKESNSELQSQFNQMLYSKNVVGPQSNTLNTITSPTSPTLEDYLTMQAVLAKTTLTIDLMAKVAGSASQSINKLVNTQ